MIFIHIVINELQSVGRQDHDHSFALNERKWLSAACKIYSKLTKDAPFAETPLSMTLIFVTLLYNLIGRSLQMTSEGSIISWTSWTLYFLAKVSQNGVKGAFVGGLYQLRINTFGVLLSIYSCKTVYVRLIEIKCSGNKGFAAGPVHSGTLLCFHASVHACFSKLGACCPKATAGNSLTTDN